MLIIRCFSRNDPLSYLNLLSSVRQFTKVKSVLVGFEFASFGDTLTTGLLSAFIWALFLKRKRITLVIHQVIFDMGKLTGHIGVSQESFLITLFNQLLKLYYKFISLPVSSIVVLEDNLKNRLSKFVNPQKIHVIPHGVHLNIKNLNLSKEKSRKALGIKDEFILLYFGYITWYKGADFLVRSLQNIREINGRKIKLILAGGPSFTQARKNHYQTFYKSVVSLIKDQQNIILTGFVEEEKIPQVFEAADLVVFPYRTFMSSSGSLATALSFEKPFLMSKNLSPILESADVQESLDLIGLKIEQLSFELTSESLLKTIKNSMQPNLSDKLKKLSTLLKEKRSFKNLTTSYADLLFPQVLEKPMIALSLE